MYDTFIKAREFGISPLAAARMRARYLFHWIDLCLEEGGELALFWAREALNEIEYLQRHAFYEPQQSTKTTLTPEQIATARQYPIEHLINFNRQGRATAWCHHDEHPSLTWYRKGNRARCFACDLTYGPIDVRMYRDMLSFPEAVRSLL